MTGFREKPPLPYWINAGVYVLTREAIGRFPDVGDHETETFPALAAARRLAAFESTAYWKSVESQKDLREAERAPRASVLKAATGVRESLAVLESWRRP